MAMRAQQDIAIERGRSISAAILMSCMFFSLGASIPFMPRWLEQDRGFNGVQIAIVLAGAQMLRLLVGPILGSWADRFHDRRTPLRVLSLISLASFTIMAFTHAFVGMAVLSFLAFSASSAIIPLAEGGALRASKAGGWPFGLMRSIGSSCYILASVLVGYHVGAQGPGIAIGWLIAGLAMAGAYVWLLAPKDPAPARIAASLPWHAGLRLLLRSRRLVLALAAAGPIQAAHAFYYGFSTLVWRGQGLEPSLIGWLWACGTATEIVFFLALSRGERRIAPEWLLLAGGIGAMIRWGLMGLAPPLAWLWPLQALHALTFAACHVGALRIVYEETLEEHAGLAGALYGAISGGTMLGLTLLASGWLYDHHGVHGYFAMAALGALGLMFSLALAVQRKRQGIG